MATLAKPLDYRAAPKPRKAKAAVKAPRNDVAAKVAEYLDCKAEAKALYDQADALLLEIVELAGVGKPVTLADGRTAVVNDPFAEKDKVVAIAFARRWELKVIGG